MYTDILCDFLCFLVPARAGSNAAPLWLKSGPESRSGSDATLFESNAAVAHPVRLSVFFGLEIGLQWFTNPYKASRLGVCLSKAIGASIAGSNGGPRTPGA